MHSQLEILNYIIKYRQIRKYQDNFAIKIHEDLRNINLVNIEVNIILLHIEDIQKYFNNEDADDDKDEDETN